MRSSRLQSPPVSAQPIAQRQLQLTQEQSAVMMQALFAARVMKVDDFITCVNRLRRLSMIGSAHMHAPDEFHAGNLQELLNTLNENANAISLHILRFKCPTDGALYVGLHSAPGQGSSSWSTLLTAKSEEAHLVGAFIKKIIASQERNFVVEVSQLHAVRSVEIPLAQENPTSAAAATQRITFSLADVTNLLQKLQKSGHLQQVPAAHTREKCVTLTAVGWIDFIDYISACEEEQVRGDTSTVAQRTS